MSAVLQGVSKLNIVSTSTLLPALRHDKACLSDPTSLQEGAHRLTPPQMAEIVVSWRSAVDRKAKSLAKTAIGNLEGHKAGPVYAQLNNPVWRRAALISEIFRLPELTKNAGWLDPSVMQSKLAMVMAGQRSLSFEIAWGQAKRPVGRLKTFGSMADLSEVVALATLAVMRTSIARYVMDNDDVQIRVLGGSARFERALFTNPEDADTYDRQRQIIANFLCDNEKITVEKFGSSLPQELRAAQELHVEECLARVTNDAIASQINTVALNVDWTRFFNTKISDVVNTPFGVALPDEIPGWIEGRDEGAVEKLIRAAVTTFINPRCHRLWHVTWPDARDVLDRAVKFVSQVSWEATRHYIALHAAGSSRSDEKGPVFRLTVHEKMHDRSMPAICTLGPRAGNQLSQHVVAHIKRDGKLWFGSVAELGLRGSIRQILVGGTPDAASQFKWLAGSRQPLCTIDCSVENIKSAVEKALDD